MDQLALPFALDQKDLAEFLTRWVAIQEQEDQLREEKRALKALYADAFPMRPVLAALKILQSTWTLTEDPTTPLSPPQLALLMDRVAGVLRPPIVATSVDTVATGHPLMASRALDAIHPVAGMPPFVSLLATPAHAGEPRIHEEDPVTLEALPLAWA